MNNKTLRIVPKPDLQTQAVIDYSGEGTIAINSKGDLNLLCGQCESVLVQGVGNSVEDVGNVVIKCNKCGAFNDTD